MIKSKKYAGVYHKLLANDKSYYITYKHNSKKVWLKIGLHSEGVREAYCFKKRAEITSKLRLGEVPDILKNKHQKTFHTLSKEFFLYKNYIEATRRDFQARYDKYIEKFIGHKSPNQIVKKDILEIHSNALLHVSTKTAELIINLTSSMFVYAIDKKEADHNPCKKLHLPKVDNTRDRFLDKKDIKKLLKECRDDKDLLLFTMLAITTGGRLSAVCSIKKKDINLLNKTVNLLDDKNDETYQAFLTKRVLELLDIEELLPNDSIFTKQQRTIQRKLQSLLNKLFNKNLAKDDRKNRVVIHTLRHTFASHLAINGTPIFTIQKLMNHKDITHTLRYAKLAPDSGRDMVEGIL